MNQNNENDTTHKLEIYTSMVFAQSLGAIIKNDTTR